MTDFTNWSKNFNDPSTSLANKNKGYTIRLWSVTYMKDADDEIVFKAFLTDFTDEYKSNWTRDAVYGRMDPLSVFQNTTREVTLSFDIPAADRSEAYENLVKVEKLIQGLYPLYQDYNSVPVISASPLWKIKMANFLSDTGNPAESAKAGGLLCNLSGFAFKPDLDQGYFVEKNGQSFPKNIKASLNATIFHNHTVGFDADSRRFISNMAGFPYGVAATLADKNAGLDDANDAAVIKFMNDNAQSLEGMNSFQVDDVRDNARQLIESPTGGEGAYAAQLKRMKEERRKKNKTTKNVLEQKGVENALKSKTLHK
jgi:hypothetical protein